MKEASWNECLETFSSRQASPNHERVMSLSETADERISLVGEIREKNCNFVFEDYYTSLLEMLQAMAVQRGFKVLNHVCLGFYLRDVLHQAELFRVFDDVRQKRNSLTYYGNRMDFPTAKNAIEQCKKLMEYAQSMIKREPLD